MRTRGGRLARVLLAVALGAASAADDVELLKGGVQPLRQPTPLPPALRPGARSSTATTTRPPPARSRLHTTTTPWYTTKTTVVAPGTLDSADAAALKRSNETLRVRPLHAPSQGDGCSSRFRLPERAPLRSTDLNGLALPDTCFRGEGPHHVFVIGDWGGVLGSAGDMPVPADRRSKHMSHHRRFVLGADDVAQIKVAKQMGLRSADHKPDYILNLGDNFYWGGVLIKCGGPANTVRDLSGQWEWVFERIYDFPSLAGKQWLGVLGNHDYGGFMFTHGWDQAIGYSWTEQHPSTGRWVTPAQYYKAKVHYPEFSVDYYFVDSNVWDAFAPTVDPEHNLCSLKHNLPKGATCGVQGPVSVAECPLWFDRLWEAEVAWLHQSLNESTADWQIIVTHFPPEHGLQIWRRLGELYGVDMLITGHRHQQEVHYLEEDNILRPTAYIVSGGGGGITSEGLPHASGEDDQYGFMDLTLAEHEIVIEAISHGGQLRSRTCVLRRLRGGEVAGLPKGRRSLCTKPQPPQRPQPSQQHPADVRPEAFDCTRGDSWSAAKRAWCCEQHRECGGTARNHSSTSSSTAEGAASTTASDSTTAATTSTSIATSSSASSSSTTSHHLGNHHSSSHPSSSSSSSSSNSSRSGRDHSTSTSHRGSASPSTSTSHSSTSNSHSTSRAPSSTGSHSSTGAPEGSLRPSGGTLAPAAAEGALPRPHREPTTQSAPTAGKSSTEAAHDGRTSTRMAGSSAQAATATTTSPSSYEDERLWATGTTTVLPPPSWSSVAPVTIPDTTLLPAGVPWQIPKVATTTGPRFECLADYYDLERKWSVEKRRWCCKHVKLGCSHIHNCSPEDPGNAIELWSVEKRAYCCLTFSLGCTAGLPGMPTMPATTTPQLFDCDADYERWDASWSDPKKDWCCRHTRRGCSQDCNYNDLNNLYTSWSVAKKQWCCIQWNIFCEQIYEDPTLADFGSIRPLGLHAAAAEGQVLQQSGSRSRSLALRWSRLPGMLILGALVAVATSALACSFAGRTRSSTGGTRHMVWRSGVSNHPRDSRSVPVIGRWQALVDVEDSCEDNLLGAVE